MPVRIRGTPTLSQATERMGTQLWLFDAKKSAIIGKMFGVLVVKTEHNKIGYLAAFSGKLAVVTIILNLFRLFLICLQRVVF